MTYDLPDALQVEADGPIRIVRLNRPEQLNATNHELHSGLADAVPAARRRPRRPCGGAHRQRPGVLGRRRLRLHRRARPATPTCVAQTLDHGRQIVTGMVGVPRAGRRRGQRARGRARLQHRRPVRHRVHGRERPPGRPPRAGRPGRRRRRAGHLAAAHQPAAGQGVRADRRPHPRRAGGARSAWSTTCAPTTRCSTGRWRAPRASPSCRSGPPRTPSASSTCTSSGPSLATLDFALTAEDRSFTSPELRANLDRLLARET